MTKEVIYKMLKWVHQEFGICIHPLKFVTYFHFSQPIMDEDGNRVMDPKDPRHSLYLQNEKGEMLLRCGLYCELCHREVVINDTHRRDNPLADCFVQDKKS